MRAQSSVWIGIAEDDIEAAEHCLKGKRYLLTMFMLKGHQGSKQYANRPAFRDELSRV